MEPPLDNSNETSPSNAYQPRRRSSRPKALIVLTVICGILAIASTTFCVFIAMQTYEKSAKIAEMETKISALETKVTELADRPFITTGVTSTNALTYDIISQSVDNPSYTQKGYYIEEQDNGHVKVTIAMGEQNGSGYSITVSNIEVTGDEAVINVEEISPTTAESSPQTSVYPTAVVEFNKLPSGLTVKTLDGSINYPDLTGTENNNS